MQNVKRGPARSLSHVLPREERQRTQLEQGLSRGVRVERRQPRQPGVEGDEQVERLLGADLAHDDPARPHPEALLDQMPQLDLAGPLQPGLSGLHRDPVGVGEPQLEDLLAGDHPVGAGDGGRQAVEHCCLDAVTYVRSLCEYDHSGHDPGRDLLPDQP